MREPTPEALRASLRRALKRQPDYSASYEGDARIVADCLRRWFAPYAALQTAHNLVELFEHRPFGPHKLAPQTPLDQVEAIGAVLRMYHADHALTVARLSLGLLTVEVKPVRQLGMFE